MSEQPVASRTFSWLHLTDLHVGMPNQDWLWPSLKTALYDDLKKVHQLSGGWDAVIFSGDLVQSGSKDEFDKLTLILEDLWAQFAELDCYPDLIVLPGNHDLKRPELNSVFRTLKRWWDEPEVRSEFFLDKSNEYITSVASIFEQYSAWVSASAGRSFRLQSGVNGLLPGDQSIILTKNGLRIGLVALNTTWLQFDADECKGQLHVDTKQLMAVTNDDPDGWCSQNDLNLLLTHQPPDWLNDQSLEYWHGEINRPGRFAAHIYGHVHAASAKVGAQGGAASRVDLQGISTFGLTKLGTKLDRAHGYSALRFREHSSSLQVWPRKSYPATGGGYNIGSDNGSNLDVAQSFTIPLSVKPAIRREEPETLSEIPHTGSIDDSLRELKADIFPAPAHVNVRTVEQKLFIDALNEYRACWLVSEWGLGEDGFVSAIKSKIRATATIYKLDLSVFMSRTQFSEFLKQTIGVNFERLCQLLAEAGDCFLLFDNVMPSPSTNDGELISELDKLTNLILEYCPAITVILRTHRRPLSSPWPIVQISALDAADLKSYIHGHPDGSIISTTPAAVAQLHRYTEGIPSRIDQALSELHVVSLSELVSADVDFPENSLGYVRAPDALVLAIRQLGHSADAAIQREFSLLKVLSLFPQGESLGRIQRFFSTSKFHASIANELRSKGLVEVISQQVIGIGSVDEPEKRLKVGLPARECVWDLLKQEEPYELNRRAAEIYFGPNWHSGQFKPPKTYRFDSPHCPPADIINANTILVRLLKEAIAIGRKHGIERVLGLADNYVRALARGDHYASAAALCADLLPIIPSHGFEEKAAYISAEYAGALRMNGDPQKAKQIIECILDHQFPKLKRQSVLLDLAFSHSSLGEFKDAKDVAMQIQLINTQSPAGLQAEALLIEMAVGDPNRLQKLQELETRSRKQDANVVAGNIALYRAQQAKGNADEVREILAPLINSKQASDYYNKTRAVVELAEISLNNGDDLAHADRVYLVRAYHFVFNEQMPTLFDRCHDALWRDFTKRNDLTNLLILFRHSSLRWRMRGQEANEKIYLEKLRVYLGHELAKSADRVAKELTYFTVRVVYYDPAVKAPPIRDELS